MIGTVVRVGLLRVWHGRVALVLDFAVPIAFFTIFAFIFGGQVGLGKSPRVNVALVDEDGTDLSRRLLGALAEQDTLRVYSPEGREGGPAVFAQVDPARERVLQGGLPLAVVVPRGWTASFLGAGDEAAPIQVLADSSDPVATQVVSALIRQVAGQIRAEQARLQIESVLGPSAAPFAASAAARFTSPVGVEVIEILAAGKASPVVSMYAAGIAVMFLLFGAVGGAGSLLEEEETQTLERLMCSQLGMTRLLAGKWLLLTIVGVAQVTVMFAWAQIAFGVDLLGHLPGFAVMTAVTAGAASSLALALAAACRTRAQLNAVAIILILTMSALGGSMVPRYVMSGTMREIGRLTFNAWALDGYTKVLWRGLPLRALLPELAVLVAAAVTLFLLARVLAHRWESV
jgi:ABC-2 type transport system permease protein